MAKAMRYFLNRNLARGWVCWSELYAEKKRKMESMRRSMSHMLNRELSRGWGAWLEMAADRKAFMQKLQHGLSRMMNRKLALGFAGWSGRQMEASRHEQGHPLLHQPQPRTWLGRLARTVRGEEAQDGVDAPQHEPHAQSRALSWLGRLAEMAADRRPSCRSCARA